MQQARPLDTPPPPPKARPVVVLDTNVILDWLVFKDPVCAGWTTLIEAGAWRWIASAEMRSEWAAVLRYPAIQAWHPDMAHAEAAWACWAQEVPAAASCPLRCTDADDQKFIDLALAHRAQWLVTKDRALLKLARRARAWQVQVQTPAALQASLVSRHSEFERLISPKRTGGACGTLLDPRLRGDDGCGRG